MKGGEDMKIKEGFTLIELLIVIAVIGVLATVLLSIIDPLRQRERAQIAKLESDVTKMAEAGEAYGAAMGFYGSSDTASETNNTCWAAWVAEGFAKGTTMPEHPQGGTNSYTISCTPTQLTISGTVTLRDGSTEVRSYDSNTGYTDTGGAGCVAVGGDCSGGATCCGSATCQRLYIPGPGWVDRCL